MPELPEVETVMRGLSREMEGRRILNITLRREGLRFPFPARLKKLRNITIQRLSRRAKYILIDLASQETLLLHLGMSGRLTLTDHPDPGPHDHVLFHLDSERIVVFHDPRRFGMLDITKTETLASHPYLRHLGPEPFDSIFTEDYLYEALKNKSAAIKPTLLDQRVVVGVGNIYASEALFAAHIDPRRPAKSLTKAELSRLIPALQTTLQKAIAAGGSSLRDYVTVDGELGYFQQQWAVYGREGQCCPRCHTPCVQKITQAGRSTFYCATQQK